MKLLWKERYHNLLFLECKITYIVTNCKESIIKDLETHCQNSSPPPTILRLQGASSHPPAILSSIRYALPTWNFLFSKKRMLWLVESSGKLVGNNLLAIFNCNISVNRYRVCIVCKTGASMKMKRWRCHGMSACLRPSDAARSPSRLWPAATPGRSNYFYCTLHPSRSM